MKCVHCELRERIRRGLPVEEEYEPEMCINWRRIRAGLRHMEQVSPEFHESAATRRAKTRVARAGFKAAARAAKPKEANARRAQFPLHKNFDELWASLPKCPAGYYRVLGDEFFSMHTLFWLGDYDTLEEAKRRADGLNSLYNWRGYVLDEYGNKVTL